MNDRDVLLDIFKRSLESEPAPVRSWSDYVQRAESQRARRRRRYALAIPVVALALCGAALGVARFEGARATPPAGSGVSTPVDFDPGSIDCVSPVTRYLGDRRVAQHIDEAFGPIGAAYLCVPGDRTDESGRRIGVSVVSKLSDDDLDALTRLLTTPDRGPGTGTCIGPAEWDPELWVVGERVSHVRLPLSGCGGAFGAHEAYALSWTEVARNGAPPTPGN